MVGLGLGLAGMTIRRQLVVELPVVKPDLTRRQSPRDAPRGVVPPLLIGIGALLGLAGVVGLVVVAAEGPTGLLAIPIAVCAAAGALMFAGMSSAARRKRSKGRKGPNGGPYRDAAEVAPDAPAPRASPAHPVEDDEEDVQPVVGRTFDASGEPPIKLRLAALAVFVASLAAATWISGWYHFGR